MKTCSLQISVLKTQQHLEEEIKDLYSLLNETELDGEKTKKPKKLHRLEHGIQLSKSGERVTRNVRKLYRIKRKRQKRTS